MRILKLILAVAALVLAGVFLLGGVGYRDEIAYLPAEKDWVDLEPSVNLQNTGTSSRYLGLFGRWVYGPPYTLFLHLTVEAADVEAVILKDLVVRADGEEQARVDELQLPVEEVTVFQLGSQSIERVASYVHAQPIHCDAPEVVVEGALALAKQEGEIEFRQFQRHFRWHHKEEFLWGI
jgi:hypothetical protein